MTAYDHMIAYGNEFPDELGDILVEDEGRDEDQAELEAQMDEANDAIVIAELRSELASMTEWAYKLNDEVGRLHSEADKAEDAYSKLYEALMAAQSERDALQLTLNEVVAEKWPNQLGLR